jgi:hypothetical protein
VRPSIDEQLAGVQRLLGLVTEDPALSPESLELVRNAERLVTRVAGAWSETLPFLTLDNERLAGLLGTPPGPGSTDVAEMAARNEALRGSLAELIRDLPATPGGRARRAEIGRYLVQRVTDDPT